MVKLYIYSSLLQLFKYIFYIIYFTTEKKKKLLYRRSRRPTATA